MRFCRPGAPVVLLPLNAARHTRGRQPKRRRRRRDAWNTATPARSVTCKPNAAARSSAVDSTGIKDAA
uniref:Uncharacterized protein n=1 Tax=Myoviridae sp. ctHFk21 TaxID=2823538 RepID=A0A8S5L5Y3_9CAUD|nr:MAG TPA: hypothetical protein [Myoviridae sp. ctHFk21]